VLIGPGFAVTTAAAMRDAGPVAARRAPVPDAPIAAEVVEVLGSHGLALLKVAAPGFDVPVHARPAAQVPPVHRFAAALLRADPKPPTPAGTVSSPDGLGTPPRASLAGPDTPSPTSLAGPDTPSSASSSAPFAEPVYPPLGEPGGPRPSPGDTGDEPSPLARPLPSAAGPGSLVLAERKLGGGDGREGEGSSSDRASAEVGGTRRRANERGALLLAYLQERARTGRLDPVLTVPALEWSR